LRRRQERTDAQSYSPPVSKNSGVDWAPGAGYIGQITVYLTRSFSSLVPGITFLVRFLGQQAMDIFSPVGSLEMSHQVTKFVLS
jgi:hypothetical protein